MKESLDDILRRVEKTCKKVDDALTSFPNDLAKLRAAADKAATTSNQFTERKNDEPDTDEDLFV